MYDYVDGKSDWMAFGLPVEGEEGPFAGDALVAVATCGPDDKVNEALARLLDDGGDRSVVVNERDVVLGLAERGDLEQSDPQAIVATVMGLSPTTVRPSVLVSSVAHGESPAIVTDPQGMLLGVVEVHPASEAATASEMDQLQSTFLGIAHAVEEHFDGEDPSEEQIRSFLHDRLVADGRTPEEAEAYLAAMDESAEEIDRG